MDQKQIEEIVRSVMSRMAQPEAAAQPATAGVITGAESGECCSVDLGSDEAKQWIGVKNPHRLDVLQELRASTAPLYEPVLKGTFCPTRISAS